MPRSLDSIFLTMSPGSPVVVPRRLRLELHEGAGALRFTGVANASEEWRASLENAWATALALTQRCDVDGNVGVPGSTPLAGGSAGLSFGLLAICALLGTDAPPHYATGTVTTPIGDLYGGAATLAKATAAARFATQAELGEVPFFAPPATAPRGVSGVRLHHVTDIGTAYARLVPGSYASIAARHLELRSAAGLPGGHVAVHTTPRPGGERRVDGISILDAPGGSGWLLLLDEGRILWQRPTPDLDDGEIVAQHRLALACAHP